MQQVASDSVDIIAETKTDSSFSLAQFCVANYRVPNHLDISNKSGSILVFIKSTQQLSFCNSIQVVTFDINLRKEKWLVVSIYRPSSESSEFFLKDLTNIIDYRLHEKIFAIG